MQFFPAALTPACLEAPNLQIPVQKQFVPLDHSYQNLNAYSMKSQFHHGSLRRLHEQVEERNCDDDESPALLIRRVKSTFQEILEEHYRGRKLKVHQYHPDPQMQFSLYPDAAQVTQGTEQSLRSTEESRVPSRSHRFDVTNCNPINTPCACTIGPSDLHYSSAAVPTLPHKASTSSFTKSFSQSDKTAPRCPPLLLPTSSAPSFLDDHILQAFRIIFAQHRSLARSLRDKRRAAYLPGDGCGAGCGGVGGDGVGCNSVASLPGFATEPRSDAFHAGVSTAAATVRRDSSHESAAKASSAAAASDGGADDDGAAELRGCGSFPR